MRTDKKIDVKYIANLARIRMDDNEIEGFSGQLDEIISYIEKLNKVDTSKTEPTTHPLPITNVFREDSLKDSLPVDKALANAPQKQDGFFRVPRVIEGE